MKIVIAAIGRLKDSGELVLAERYIERINGYARTLAIGPVRVIEMPESRAASAEARRDDEAARLLKAVSEAGAIVVLDETGTSLTSEAFAAWTGRQRDGGTSMLAFVIGGPDGHGPLVQAKASLKLAFGPMTLPHGLARVVLAEQIYRAATILAGHPYHRV